MKKTTLILLFLVCLNAPVVQAKMSPAEAAQKKLDAVTVFMDVNKFNRKNMAAKKMTGIHEAYAQYGYELISVNPYTENGDLEGFFLSYRKRR